jgi:hypothetical protein
MLEWLKLRKISAVILLMGFASEAFAQGCAMCLASASSQSPGAMAAMNLGIIILLIPSFVMILAILLFTFFRRH